MNPVNRFKIDNYKEILKEINTLGKLEHLRELEDRMIGEIARLVELDTDEAKLELQKLEKSLEEDFDFKPKNKLLFSALKNSLAGALSAVKFLM